MVYENVAPEIPRLAPFPVAAVFVASPSAARRLVAANPWVRQTRFLTIGPTTASAVRDLGVGSVRAIGSTLTDWIEHLCAAHRLAIGSVT
ncbi:MAG: uroporphyrinogen-III synthase [Candidatus Riflebacteria bacterium]|nr:uroporphyrinogen-III synthase [Candidatus Riflebacteria bacterium]